MRHLFCDPKIEIVGSSVIAIAKNAQADEIAPFLEKYDLATIDPNQWYPAQQLLNLMNDLTAATGTTGNFVAIGLAIAKLVPFPPEPRFESLESVLMMWNDIYQNDHRGGDIGIIKTDKLSDTHFMCTLQHIYPDDLMYGVAFGFADRLLPNGTEYKVWYDNATLRLDLGGDQTIIHIEWQVD